MWPSAANPDERQAMGSGPVVAGGDPLRPRRMIGSVIGRVAPVVIRQIDLDAVVEQLDINAIAEKLDLDALVARLDVNAVAQQLDLDALVAQLDVNAIAEELDLDALMARIDMAQLTAGATQEVAASGLDLARRQLMRADRTIDGLFDRLLRRKPGERHDAPVKLVEPTPLPAADAEESPEPRRRGVSGHYAGPVTRTLALVGDLFAAVTSYGMFGAITLYLLGTFTGVDLTITAGGWVNRVLVASWLLFWFWIPVALFGRTLVMAVVGLAVVRRDGGIANGRRALVRTLVLPASLIFLGLGAIGMLIGRERRTLHDVAAGTVVVYDWGARQAEQPATIRDQLSARVSRRRDAESSSGESG